jgi:hypothetical protein
MKFTTFLQLVAEMRGAQRTFHAKRNQSSLVAAKNKELEVDTAIREALQELGQTADVRQDAMDFGFLTPDRVHRQPTIRPRVKERTIGIEERLETRHG